VSQKKSIFDLEKDFEKAYVKAVLTYKTPVVSYHDLIEAIHPIERYSVVEFSRRLDFKRWVVYARDEPGAGSPLIALPYLVEKIRKLKLENIIAWLYYSGAKNLIHKLIGDATLECDKRNGYLEAILISAKGTLETKDEWIAENEERDTGKLVYKFYDTVLGRQIYYGSIVITVEECGICYYDMVFNFDLRKKEPRHYRCVTYDFA